MWHCPNCGAEIPAAGEDCPECGGEQLRTKKVQHRRGLEDDPEDNVVPPEVLPDTVPNEVGELERLRSREEALDQTISQRLFIGESVDELERELLELRLQIRETLRAHETS